jgi:diacylglycerol kinase (ATP)
MRMRGQSSNAVRLPMKITLIHNPSAGGGQGVESLVQLMTDAGHEVIYRSRKQGWESALTKPADLVVAAGGDGTVRRVALAAASKGLPFAAFPIGTANNIAKSIGVLGDASELIESWSSSPRAEQPFDLGEVVAPWGSERFVEGFGGGLVADLINRAEEVAADATLLGQETDRALHLLAELVRDAPLHHWQINADGVDLSGDYFAFEVLNIRLIGPNLPLAPQAYPGDGLLDIVRLDETDREPLLAYLESRLHLASGQLPDLEVVRAREIEIAAPAGVRWHLDDRNWPSARPPAGKAALRVRCLAGAVTFVAVPKADRSAPS